VGWGGVCGAVVSACARGGKRKPHRCACAKGYVCGGGGAGGGGIMLTLRCEDAQAHHAQSPSPPSVHRYRRVNIGRI